MGGSAEQFPMNNFLLIGESDGCSLLQALNVIGLVLPIRKEYNAWLGASCGRRLALIGASLTGSLRSGDMACRYGGEEFVAILPDPDPRFARVTAERIRDNLRLRWEKADSRLSGACAVIMGESFSHDEAISVPSLVLFADLRRYLGKRRGRDRIVLQDPVTT